MTRGISARIGLLDKQLADRDRLEFGRIDDLQIEIPTDGRAPRVTALLTGTQALAPRLGGRASLLLARASSRLRTGGHAGPVRIDVAAIAEIEPVVRLSVGFADLRDAAPLERWLAGRFIGRLPGARRASE